MTHPTDSEPARERERPVVDNLDRFAAMVGEDDQLVPRYFEGSDIDAETDRAQTTKPTYCCRDCR
ncbi:MULTISPECIES: hypothetical protein [Rhodococcus]|uniref:hypothetical protein n=1 Tax=Rhodococcus TaxID=1827 RepID=UPI00110F60DC|nr:MULTISPECIES: hypothetical protein [Rhodococcus]